MVERKFDELISYFNRKVSDMDIDRQYKMELLGMVTALGYAHEKETEERKTGRWIKPKGMMPPEHHGHYECSECGAWAGRNWLRPWKEIQLSNFCPNCGAKMEGET